MPDVLEFAELLKGVKVGDDLEKNPGQNIACGVKNSRGNAQSPTE
ncbi:hypothetical protein [Anaplasma platys]|nr:hypothetical protein [Anaplasma platys]